MYLTEDDFKKHLRNLQEAPYIVCDTEGTLNHPFSQTWGLSTSALGIAEYFAFNHMLGQNLPHSWLPQMKEVIEVCPLLVMHNAKHDLRALRNLDIHYKGPFFDTQIATHMVDENIPSKELEYLTRMLGGEPKRNGEVIDNMAKAFGYEYIPTDVWRPYGIGDASDTNDLYRWVRPQFEEQGFDGELWDWEQKSVLLHADIEDTGILIDQELCQHELNRGLGIMEEIKTYLGFNPGSPIQLGKFLLEEMGLPIVKRTKKGNKPSFDKDAMEVYDELLGRMNDNRARQILIYKGWSKVTGSSYKPYLRLVQKDGRLRVSWKLHGPVTGRTSCEYLHQIPRESEKDWNGKLKQAFITEKGRTAWSVDFSQLELRLAAAYGKVENLIEIFADPDRDIFSEMAKDLGMARHDTKTLNYTLQFSGGAQRISEVFGVSIRAAEAIKNNYFKKYHGLATIAEYAKNRAIENGYVQYWTGRRRHFKYQDESRKAFNSVIQGGAFEIVKRSGIRLKQEGLINDECKLDLQVHDMYRFDIENGKEHTYLPEIKRVMEDVQPDFGVRFKVDITKWGTKEQYHAA